VLRGAGAGIALPLLNCMIPLRGAAADAAATQAKRSVFVYMPNGVNSLDFQITDTGANYGLPKTLAPLMPHRDLFTPVSGLYHPNGLGKAHNVRDNWLTGGQVGQSARNSISVDQLIAAQSAPFTRFSSLELSNKGGSLAWSTDGVNLPAMGNPSEVFRALFEEPAGGVASQRRGLNRKGSILDLVLSEANSLARQLGKEDHGRLDQYLTSVREVEVRTERADKWLDVPRPKIDGSVRDKLNRNVSQEMVGDYFRTLYDLVVLAFQTDATRVATLSTGIEGQGLKIPEIGIDQDRHSLSHHGHSPKVLAKLTQSDRFNVALFGYFLKRLQEVHDAHGPLLDTTVALFGSGMSYGHSHGCANLPIVVAGGSALGFKHGQHIDLNRAEQADFQYHLDNPGKYYKICHQPVNDKALMSNLLLTIAQGLGVEVDRFADSTGGLAGLRG
jgi:hypothetical protein